jgi:secreted Zn-dependent insulinase-like peptidase
VQVAGVLFQFVGQVMMKGGPQERFFEEYTAVQQTKHEYYEEPEPLSLVKWCARMLLPRHKVPNSQLLRARLNTRWQPDEIESFCQALTPTNCRIDLASKLYGRLAKRNLRKAATGNAAAFAKVCIVWLIACNAK